MTDPSLGLVGLILTQILIDGLTAAAAILWSRGYYRPGSCRGMAVGGLRFLVSGSDLRPLLLLLVVRIAQPQQRRHYQTL